MSNPEIVRTKVEIFAAKHSVDFEITCHTVSDLRGYNGDIHIHWKEYAKQAGVYALFDTAGGGTHYIGMSSYDAGNRMHEWIFQDNKVNSVICPADKVMLVTLKDHYYMAPALELFLIALLEPKLNKISNYSR